MSDVRPLKPVTLAYQTPTKSSGQALPGVATRLPAKAAAKPAPAGPLGADTLQLAPAKRPTLEDLRAMGSTRTSLKSSSDRLADLPNQVDA